MPCGEAEDARITHRGAYGGWLLKEAGDGSVAKFLRHPKRRLFTINFDSQSFFYSRGEGDNSTSTPILFTDILKASVEADAAPRRGLSALLLAGPGSARSGNSGRRFVVCTKKRSLRLTADTVEDAEIWVAALSAARSLALKAQASESAGSGAAREALTSLPSVVPVVASAEVSPEPLYAPIAKAASSSEELAQEEREEYLDEAGEERAAAAASAGDSLSELGLTEGEDEEDLGGYEVILPRKSIAELRHLNDRTPTADQEVLEALLHSLEAQALEATARSECVGSSGEGVGRSSEEEDEAPDAALCEPAWADQELSAQRELAASSPEVEAESAVEAWASDDDLISGHGGAPPDEAALQRSLRPHDAESPETDRSRSSARSTDPETEAHRQATDDAAMALTGGRRLRGPSAGSERAYEVILPRKSCNELPYLSDGVPSADMDVLEVLLQSLRAQGEKPPEAGVDASRQSTAEGSGSFPRNWTADTCSAREWTADSSSGLRTWTADYSPAGDRGCTATEMWPEMDLGSIKCELVEAERSVSRGDVGLAADDEFPRRRRSSGSGSHSQRGPIVREQRRHGSDEALDFLIHSLEDTSAPVSPNSPGGGAWGPFPGSRRPAAAFGRSSPGATGRAAGALDEDGEVRLATTSCKEERGPAGCGEVRARPATLGAPAWG